MNVSPELSPILTGLQKRFRNRLDAVHSPRADEIYVHAKMDLVAGFTAHLCRKWKARLVNLFADDARQTDGSFHLYYVFALDAAHGFIILRVPVSPDKPEFASLTNAIPGVNWQEREVQDLFGLKLIGHPNPRRCALHDDWPEVHPLRKDFDLRTQLPPFQGERHKFRGRRGRFSSARRPGSRGRNRAGTFSVQRGGRAGFVFAVAPVLCSQRHGETF